MDNPFAIGQSPMYRTKDAGMQESLYNPVKPPQEVPELQRLIGLLDNNVDTLIESSKRLSVKLKPIMFPMPEKKETTSQEVPASTQLGTGLVQIHAKMYEVERRLNKILSNLGL